MHRDLLVLTLLASLLFGWALGSRDFWEPDEPDFALISREMLESGDWIVPTRNRRPYAEKPPLTYWMVAGLGKLTGQGVNGWTARIPSALSGILGILAVYAMGRRWMGRETGIAAALVLLGLPFWMLSARTLFSDMPLASFTAVAMLGLGRTLVDGVKPAWWGFAALGLAVLAKGPLAGAFVACALLGGGILLQRNPFRHPGRWILGAGILLAVVAPWYLAVRGRDPAFFREVLWGQNLRFVETVSHRRPWHYYAGPVLLDLLPWTLALAAAVPLAWKRRYESPPAALALAWLGGGVVLLSFSTVKQEKYLLPLMPAAALLAGWALTQGPWALRWTLRLSSWLLALLGGILAMGAWLFPSAGGAFLGMALAALAGAVALALCRDLGPLSVSGAMAGFFLAVATLGFPLLEKAKSARIFSRAAAARAGSRPLAFYGEDLQAAYPYYAERRLDYVEADAKAGGRRVETYLRFFPDALLILRQRDLRRLPEGLQSRLETVLPPWNRGLDDLLSPQARGRLHPRILDALKGKDDVLAVRLKP